MDTSTPMGTCHLTSQDIASWIGGACQESELFKMQDHCLLCADCREQVALVLQAVRADSGSGDETLFELLSQIGEEAARQVKSLPYPRKADSQQSSTQSQYSLAWPRKLWPYESITVWGGAIAGLIFILGICIWAFLYRSTESQGLATLNRAYREQRPLEARITGFVFAPFFTTKGKKRNPATSVDLEEAGLLLHKAAREKQSPKSFHELGKFYLAKKGFDQAIEQFEAALRLAPNSASLHCDLGAALLEKGRTSGNQGNDQQSAVELGRSLDELNKAVALDDGLLEAHFNRALCRQVMGLYGQAEEGWKQYLEKDDSSPWAEEARRNLKLLEERKKQAERIKGSAFNDFIYAYAEKDEIKAWDIFRAARSRTGNAISERLIEEWLLFSSHSRWAEAEARLEQLTWAGVIEAKYVDDYHTADLAAYYKRLKVSNRSFIAEARQVLKLAAASYDRQNLSYAAELFSRAETLFNGLGDTCEASFAESWLGYCLTRLGNVKASLTIFDRLTKRYQKKRYGSLLAYALHSVADAHTGQDRFSASIEAATRGLEIAKRLEDPLCELRLHGTLASVHSVLGKNEEALTDGLRSVELARRAVADAKQVWGTYSSMASCLLSLEKPWAALDVQREVHHLAVKAGWPGYKSLSLARMAMISNKLGRLRDCIKYAEKSVEEAVNTSDESVREGIMADALFYLGHVLRLAGEHTRALASYTQAIAYYNNIPFKFYLYKCHEGSFLSHVALQDDARAVDALEKTRALLSRFRGEILEESSKNSFFDTGQEFYDAAIDFELSRGKGVVKAFQLSEDSRARSLLDAKQSSVQVLRKGKIELRIQGMAKPFGLSQIQRRLPPTTQIVQYSVLQDQVVAWVITPSNITLASKAIAIEHLKQKVEDIVKQISSPHSDSTESVAVLAKALHTILINPIERTLNPNLLVCIVPDKVLHFLPFAALLSRDTGKYLIEEYKIIIAPSATTFILCSEAAKQKALRGQETLLSVGDPAFDYKRYPYLPRLSAASEEARRIASLYQTRILLLGPDAKESVIRKYILSADVAHISGHAISDERSPLMSALILAPDAHAAPFFETSDGSLNAYELYQLGPINAKLVILSACQTGTGQSFRGEGVISLVRPFISSNVPAVIASQGNVEPRAAEKLMVAFHEHRVHGRLPTLEALRQAQLGLLKGGDHKHSDFYVGTLFSAYGGVSQY